MSLFSWFDKKDSASGSGECANCAPITPAPDCYTKAEVDAIRAKLADEINAALSELSVRLTLNIVKHDDVIAEVRSDILAITSEPKPEYVTPEQLNFVVDSISKEIERIENTPAAIVDPAPFTPPMGWMNALQQEVDQRVDSLKAYVDDSVAAYAVNEDVELEEKLANLSPLSAEEIDALYMDEQEATAVAQKTLNGFRAEMYNKAVTDLKVLTSARPTIAAVKAFLVSFVESMKPV
jgi:hypothetical protein